MMAIGAYAAFLILAAVLTVRVGFLLSRHGELVLRDRREGTGSSAPRARSIGRLTLLGFSLVSAGAVALLLRLGGQPQSVLDALVFLATRLGVLSLVLGITQFHCLSILSRASAVAAGPFRDGRTEPARPRRAREDPLDRVFETIRLDAPSGV